MRKNKPISLVYISLLVLSTLIILYTPNVMAAVSFNATISPSVVSGVWPPVSTKFTINVTGSSATDAIDKVEITYPSTWTYVSAEAPTGWSVTHSAPKVTFTTTEGSGQEITGGVWKTFNVTVKVESGFGAGNTWNVKCTDSTTSNFNAMDLTVYVTPWFDATITPDLKKAGETLWFEIKVTNNASESSIKIVAITYPNTDGWEILDYTGPTGWTYAYSPPTITFTAPSGYEIAKNSYVTFRFKMKTGTPSPSDTEIYNWPITCTNTLGKTADMTSTVTIDGTKPTITVVAPDPTKPWYSVGAGNYMWLNITVHDDVNKEPIVVLNDTRFALYAAPSVSGSYDFKFCYRNNTAILDGYLAIQVNVTDYVGNQATVYPKNVETTVDNTPPFIWITVTPATLIDSTFWVGKTQTTVNINVTVADYELESIGPLTGIYINGTLQSGWTFGSTTKKYNGYPVWEHVETSYSIPTDKNYWIVYVNVTDKAVPKNHTSEMTVYIKRDLVPPHAIGFTSTKAICGGLVIYGLYASDNVGVYDFVFKVNGTSPITVYQYELEADYWTGGYPGTGAFAGIVVLDLTGYTGDYVNITVLARDYGYNEGATIVVYTGTVPEGLWYPVELQKKWNIMSLPLWPINSSIEAVLSLLLKPELLKSVWTYDAETGSWLVYSPGAPSDLTKMEDGRGYLMNMTDYDVLIVQGMMQPPFPQTPRVYHVVPGWNLIGYKETFPMEVEEYLAGVSYVRVYMYWPYPYEMYYHLYDYNDMYPGFGYWVAVTEEGWIYP